MKKKTELAIEEDLLIGAMEAADETGVDLSKFIEGAIRERLFGHAYWKAQRELRMKEIELQKGKSAVEKSRGFMNVDRETIEAILQEPSYLDV
ncbi:MAG: hypothetical protein OXC95_13650 [Dehalococcoidia bacterium]|nr:hypothetical protein [Dehalococcoidia bacterium]